MRQLVRGDSVVFAHVGQSRKIICIATLDASSSGRVTLRGEQQRKDVPGSHARRIFNREYLYDQATFTLFWTIGSSLTVFVLGLEVWDWGSWSYIFFGLSAILFILVFVVESNSDNYENMTTMELDIGYVQYTEKWLKPVADNADIEYQRIVIAESAPPNSLEKREHTATDESIVVQKGDLVMLTTNARIILKLRRMVFPPLSLEREEEDAEHNLRQLREEHPELLSSISRVLFDVNPIGINFEDYTDEYEGESGYHHYSTSRVLICCGASNSRTRGICPLVWPIRSSTTIRLRTCRKRRRDDFGRVAIIRESVAWVVTTVPG